MILTKNIAQDLATTPFLKFLDRNTVKIIDTVKPKRPINDPNRY